MLTIDSFCNSVWDTSYSKVSNDISKDEYKEFEIPKRNGVRTISYLEKDSKLGDLQKKLFVNFLEKQVTPTCVKGFKKGESYKTYLTPHVGAKFYLRVDIESFFPSISDTHVKNEISNLVVCNSDEDKEKILSLISDMVTLNGSLPQGACTSPVVSNLVMARIDQRILKYCQVFDVRYTRYADDLLFSSNDFDFSEKRWFLKKIKHILHSQEFNLNYSKIKSGREELVLNGYVISNTGIRLSRNRLSDIRHIISFADQNHVVLETSGEDAFLLKANVLPLKYRDLTLYPFGSVFQFIQYMCGYRAFLISLIDNNFASTPFQKELQHLIRKIERQVLQYS